MALHEKGRETAREEKRGHHLLLRIDGEAYGLPLDRIRQVLLRSDVEIVPFDGDEMLVGALQGRGAPIPVIELRSILGLPKAHGIGSRQGIVVIGIGEESYGLLVDECRGVKSFDTSALTSFHSTLLQGGDRIFSGLVNDGKEIVLFLDERHMFPSSLQEKIAALLADSDRFLELYREVKALEMALEEKPTVDGFLELAELYQKQGRKKDAERSLLMAESMERSVEATEEGKLPVLRGTLENGMLVEVLQMLTIGCRSGDLTVDLPGEGGKALIHFRKGQVWDAKIGWKVGRDAFREIIARREGLWQFNDDRQEPIERRITKNTQFLILDAMKVRDEEGREGKGAPEPDLFGEVAGARRDGV